MHSSAFLFSLLLTEIIQNSDSEEPILIPQAHTHMEPTEQQQQQQQQKVLPQRKHILRTQHPPLTWLGERGVGKC